MIVPWHLSKTGGMRVAIDNAIGSDTSKALGVGGVMKAKTSLGAEKVRKIARAVANRVPETRMKEIRWSAGGGILGAAGGAIVLGGMGLALLGTAIPVSGALVVGVAGAAIGNKIGSELDRRRVSKSASEHVGETIG